jgi:hypothetical protein
MPNDTGETQTKTSEAEPPAAAQGWAPVDKLEDHAQTAQAENNEEFFPEVAPPETAPAEAWGEPAAARAEALPLETISEETTRGWWETPPATEPWAEPPPSATPAPDYASQVAPFAAPVENSSTSAADTGGAYFCGDTSFFSLNWALHTIAAQRLTGTLRSFWNREPVDLLARNGQIVLATTLDPELYCPEAPITLVNIDEESTARARQQQRETGRPLFVTLAQEGLIVREPSVQLVQHYGQKLFAQLWTASRVRFMFEQSEQLPDYTQDIASEEDVDHWALSTLRFIQFSEIGSRADYDPNSIPAYTRDGFERVQQLRLTVSEAQFASQFNGVRSIAQIAKNLRLDVKFARLTLFRFLALEIVECWPPAAVSTKQEKRGVFGRMFGE